MVGPDPHPSSAPLSSAPLTAPDKSRLVRRAAMASVTVALVLMGLKLWAWWQSGSVAVLSSLTDSGLDALASIVTLLAVRYAAKPPDEEHRFGHGKAEAFAGLFQAALVMTSAALVGREAVVALLNPQPLSQSGAAIGVMGISMVLTLGLVMFQAHVHRATGSVAIAGDRLHYVGDLLGNLVVLLGVAVAGLWGWLYADALAGLLVCAWLIWGAIQVLSEAANQLMDRELDDQERERIAQIVAAVPGSLGLHYLRTRASGTHIHMQFHLDVPPDLSLVEAHELMVAVENALLGVYPGADILIHPDPKGEAEPHGSDVFDPNGLR